MAQEQSKKKVRRLRPAETMRERAERATEPKQRRIRVRLPFGDAIMRFFGRVGKLKLWKPFVFAGRFLNRFLVPPYLRNSWRELRQVTWPDRKQSRQLTVAVILFSLIFGVLVTVFDYGLDKVFKAIILKR